MSKPTLCQMACVIGTLLTLSSCSYIIADDQHKSVCNELNSRIIFYGNTSNVRASEIQSAQQPLMQKNYDKNQCYK